MAHISDLSLLEYLAGEGDLSPEQLSHLQDCDDCAERAIEFRQVLQHYGDLSEAKRFLVDEEELEVPEAPEEQDHPRLDERAG